MIDKVDSGPGPRDLTGSSDYYCVCLSTGDSLEKCQPESSDRPFPPGRTRCQFGAGARFIALMAPPKNLLAIHWLGKKNISRSFSRSVIILLLTSALKDLISLKIVKTALVYKPVEGFPKIVNCLKKKSRPRNQPFVMSQNALPS